MEPAPPHQVSALLPLILIQGHEGLADIVFHRVKYALAPVGLSVDVDITEGAVVIQQDAAVVHQVIVVYLVESALGQKELHVLLQLLAVLEGVHEAVHNLLLLLGKGIGILPVHRREVHIQHLVGIAVDGDGALVPVDQVQQVPVFHVEFRMPHDGLSLGLPLQDGDGLVHLQVDLDLLRIIGAGSLQLEHGAGVIRVGRGGVAGQRQHVDAVAILQDIHVAVAGADADDVADAAQLSCCRSHPENIVIAPLDVQGVVLHQLVHNNMGAWAAVKDIAHDMQMVHNQPLNQLT